MQWTSTRSDCVSINDYVDDTATPQPARKKIGRVSIVPQGPAGESAKPSELSFSVSPRTGLQIVIACGLGWFVFFGGGFGGGRSGTGSGDGRRLVTDQQSMVFDNAVQETKSIQFEKAAPGYIERYAPVAIQEMERYGIPASISLAQGLLESRAGTSKLAVQTNNHFGLKCFSRGCKKGHCKNFTDDTHKDFFLNYSGGPWGSWRQHSLLLSQGRYKKLHGRDWQGWADGLQAVGYATDPGYSAALKQIIKRYGLSRLDK